MNKITLSYKTPVKISYDAALNGDEDCPFKYKLYDESYAGCMPKLLKDGRRPLSVAEVMEKRIDVLNKPIETCHVWWNDRISTGDAIAYHPDGRFKIVLDSSMLREITPEKVDPNSSLLELGDSYEKIAGDEFKIKDFDSYPYGFKRFEDASNDPILLVLSRDSTLLKAYFDAALMVGENFVSIHPEARNYHGDYNDRHNWYKENVIGGRGILNIELIRTNLKTPALHRLEIGGINGDLTRISGDNGRLLTMGSGLIGIVESSNKEKYAVAEKIYKRDMSNEMYRDALDADMRGAYIFLHKNKGDSYLATHESHPVAIELPEIFEPGAEICVRAFASLNERKTLESMLCALADLMDVKERLQLEYGTFGRLEWSHDGPNVVYKIPMNSADDLSRIARLLGDGARE